MAIMDKRGIELAREWLDLPDALTDEEISDGLRGSSTETRIEFKLAADDARTAFLEAMSPIVQAFRDAALRPFDRG